MAGEIIYSSYRKEALDALQNLYWGINSGQVSDTDKESAYLLKTGDSGEGDYYFNTDQFVIDSVHNSIGINTISSEGHSLAINAVDGFCLQLIYNDVDSNPTNYANIHVDSGGNLIIDASGGVVSFNDNNIYTTGGAGIGAGDITGGVVNVGYGFRITNTAAANAVLRGNGTNFVSSAAAALTRTDDTNVTLTLGGTPSTALLDAVSLTLGWSGQLAVSRGGSGVSSHTAYAVLCGGTTATGAVQSITSVGSSGQVLTSNGAGALPTFQDASGGEVYWELNESDNSIYNTNDSGNGAVGIGTNGSYDCRGIFDVYKEGNIYLVHDTTDGSTQTLYLPGHIFMAPYNGSNICYLQARRGNSSGSTELQMRVYNAGSLVEAIRINYVGNVGIGDTSPTEGKLVVIGGAYKGVYATSDSDIGVYGYSAAAHGIEGKTISDSQYQAGVHGVEDGYDSCYGVWGESLNSSIGVYGTGSTGVYGVGTAYGVVGNGTVYDFYATGSGTNYGPFTGGHEVKISDIIPKEQYLKGMIVSCTGEVMVRKDSISSTLPIVVLSSESNDKKVFGVFNSIVELRKDHWYEKSEGEYFAAINALGEGRVLVTNINGNIECGDYITTSNIAGYGMKQEDDLMHNYTLGKVTETIDWEIITETLVYNNVQYKVYLIGVIYTSA